MKYQQKTNKNTIRISSLLLAVAISTLGGVAALAWGPNRPTYTIDKPADKITFNAITNNPNHGDERNFTNARRVDESANQWRDVIEVDKDAEYIVRMYVHNNAAANLNLVAENVRARASVPNVTGNRVDIQGQISANNATPKEIWDQVVFKSASRKFNIAYIPGTARYYTNANPSQGFQLSDKLTTNEGSLLGYDKLDGRIPGCFQYSGILTFKVKVQTEKKANFNVSKQVRKLGEADWKKQIRAKVGDKIEYRLGYDNIGEVAQNNVMMKDFLPKGISYQSGSTFIKNASNPNGDGMNLQSNELAGKGINIGNYNINSNAFVKFTAQVGSDGLVCGANNLVNRVKITTEHGEKEDSAVVVVDRHCTPAEEKDSCPIPGKGHLKKGDKDCYEPCKIPGKENLKSNDPKCAQVPAELPKTGPMEAALMIIAITAISGGVAYYYRSHEEMKKLTSTAGKSKAIEAEQVQNDQVDQTHQE